MSNISAEISEKYKSLPAMFKFKVAVYGAVRDFWKDGGKELSNNNEDITVSENVDDEPSSADVKAPKGALKADRIQILEKLWGTGRIIPGGHDYWLNLTVPIGLDQEKSVLDLTAGLGEFARFIAEEYNAYVTGLERDNVFAARGMILSIAAGKSKHASITPYDPSVYTASRKYDCVFAQELFYSIIGKDDFFNVINDSIKNGGGQLVFTDFLLNPEDREKKSIKNWMKKEKNAAPLSIVETTKKWKAMGYDVRITEDKTEEYKVFIIKGLADFVKFISEEKPDKETKILILSEIEFWATRYMALKDGLKFYRINAIKC